MAPPAHLTGPASLRRRPRLTFALPVKIRGRDADGNPFTEQTRTIDINDCGGKLQTRYLMRPRDAIYIENPMLKVAAMAHVAWVGRRKNPADPWEIGIALDKPQNIWGVAFPSESASAPLASRAQGSSEARRATPPAMGVPAGQNRPVVDKAAPALPASAHPSGKFSGPAALRRSTRLTFSVAITISGRDADGKPFTEETRTIGVNKHGGKLYTSHKLRLHDPISIENPKAKLTAQATIAWVAEKKRPNDPWEIGVELDKPQNIWGIGFPPDDWEEPPPLRAKDAPAAVESAAPVAAIAPTAVPESSARPPDPAAETQVGVAPPVLVSVAPRAGNWEAPATMPASPSPPVAEALAGAAQMSEQMKLLAEAHSRLFQKEFAELAAGIRESLQKEIQEMVESGVRDASAKVRQQMQHDLEAFGSQITELRQTTEDGLSSLRKRLAAMLASLDAPPGNDH